MRKAIALSFLLLANIMVMAHAVVPHHHCDDMLPICQCNHSHSYENIGECSLSTIYIRFDKEKQISQSLDFNTDFHRQPCVLALFLDCSSSQIIEITGLPLRQKPHLLFYLSEYISQSVGLRAPPFEL